MAGLLSTHPSSGHSRKEGDLLNGLGASANRPFMALQVPKKRKRIKQTKATSSEWMRDFMVISPSVR
ncbi:MAG: hypothetical protein OP8BY_2443 [Candidatus Saccharicenans subterraneus]|uniref:Uncharacterized protein n=1 Tax=Candidatus Saccharicenans subterraneus TaxID=2508984 RepID=A0A3E2BJ45_9BACT|nr:MAG: hypothetical protein OP8BY_2443 [Candidatus Saccharicenans subterraneum]